MGTRTEQKMEQMTNKTKNCSEKCVTDLQNKQSFRVISCEIEPFWRNLQHHKRLTALAIGPRHLKHPTSSQKVT